VLDVSTAIGALALVALAVGLSLWQRVGVERSILWAAFRAAVQLLAVGAVFTVVIGSDLADWWAWVWVVVMVLVAGETARRRAKEVPGLRSLVMAAIAASTGIALAIVFGTQVFDLEPVIVVVVAGITIGNTLPGTVLAVDRSAAYLSDNRSQIEGLLALGFDGKGATRFLVRDTARLALTPQIERTKVVGLIALPGAMTGLLLAGVDPIEAVVVQLVVMYLVLGAVSVAVIVVVTFIAKKALTPDLRLQSWIRP
jgi:putative ABC transport system permease protein